MDERAIGIDIGTSYLKATAVDTEGRGFASARVASPLLRSDAFCIDTINVRDYCEAVTRLLQSPGFTDARRSWATICVSAISPVLVLFDQTHPAHADAIPYWRIARLDGRNTGLERSLRRLDHLCSLRDMKAMTDGPAVSDLVGYINFRLTGELTLNSVAAAELGIGDHAALEAVFAERGLPVPRVGRPSQICGYLSPSGSASIGLRSGSPVCFGCPDSLATAYGAGAVAAGSWLIYLGTFGSLMLVSHNIGTALDSGSLEIPYGWRVSVPGLGHYVEAQANEMFPGVPVSRQLSELDRASDGSPLGAGGYFLELPHWDALGSRCGDFSLVHLEGNVRSPSQSERSQAIFESLGYALSVLGPTPDPLAPVLAAGGGRRSDRWLRALATILRTEISVSDAAHEAAGPALIGLRSIGKAEIKLEPAAKRFSAEDTSCTTVQEHLAYANRFYGRCQVDQAQAGDDVPC